MKHFTAFATTLLLWLCAITAWADGVVVADTYTTANDITEGYYLVKAYFRSGEGTQAKPFAWKNYYAYHNSSDGRPFRIKEESSVDKTTLASNLQYVWYITKNANGQLVFQNASTGGFLPADGARGGNCSSSNSISNAAILQPVSFTTPDGMTTLEGGVHLKQCNRTTTDGDLFLHCNQPTGDPNLSYWTGNNVNGTAVQFVFYKLTLPDGTTTKATPAYGAQIKQEVNGSTLTAWKVGLKDAHVPSLITEAHSFYWVGNHTFGEATTNAEITVTETIKDESLIPITLSTPETPVYYKLRFRNNSGSNCVIYKNDNEISTASSYNSATDYANIRGAQWAIVESGKGVKLYNAKAKKYVTATAANEAQASMTDEGTIFYMQTSSNADFSLQYENTLGYLGDHYHSKLGTWNHNGSEGAQNDGGSGYKAIAVDESDLRLAISNVPKAFSNQTNTENALTIGNTADAIEKGKTALTKYNSTSPSWENLDEVFAALDGVNLFAQPDLNAYYRIRNVNSGLANRYLSSENIVVATNGSLNTAYTSNTGMDRKITRKSDSDNFGSQLWKFTKNNDGTFTIRNANTDREMGEATTTSIEMPINIGAGNGHYKFMPYTEDAFTDYDANSMFIMYDVNGNQVGINGENYIFRNNDHFNEKSNYWQIIKVTEVPVMISTTAGWASVAYPFAVQVPSDVKAYIAATAKDDVLTLQEITDGIIPANTGALLTKDGGGLVNLTITTTSTTYADNKLTASTAERSGFTAKDTYVLAAKSGKVGLYPSTLTIVPSNKAYLLKKNITTTASGEAQMMNFVVDGTVTGINAVESNVNKANDSTYYDLNGRRVLYPTRGIYVKGNGQKVFIK